MTILIALTAWPAVVMYLFRRMAAPMAILAGLIAGYLFLPTASGLDLPLLPELNKDSIPVLAVIMMVYALGLHEKSDVRRPLWYKPDGRAVLLGTALVLGALGTTLTNLSPLNYGRASLPGMRIYDFFSLGLGTIVMLLPLVVARRFLARPEDHKLALWAIAVAGLAYSFLALIEVRLSPQLSSWVYGVFAHDWKQHLRGDGYRPIIFLSHGLLVGILFACAILSAAGIWRLSEGKMRPRWLLATLWLLLVLLLCKSLGAFIIALVLLPVAFFFSARAQIMTAAVIAVCFLTYPMLRGIGAIPTNTVVSIAEQISTDRASSLQFRLGHEDNLLAKAEERPLFGWGIWGRSRVYDEKGNDISVTDGYWVLVVGEMGWIGYLGQFGLLAGPIILLAMRSRQYAIGPETALLSLVLAANLVDLIPNAGLSPLTWLISGMLWGRYELGHMGYEADRPPVQGMSRKLRYTRTSDRGPASQLPENPRPRLAYSRSPEKFTKGRRDQRAPG